MTLPAYPAAPVASTAPARPPGPSLHAALGCASCGLRRYCALAVPDSPCPPANCPFGPGPAPR